MLTLYDLKLSRQLSIINSFILLGLPAVSDGSMEKMLLSSWYDCVLFHNKNECHLFLTESRHVIVFYVCLINSWYFSTARARSGKCRESGPRRLLSNSLKNTDSLNVSGMSSLRRTGKKRRETSRTVHIFCRLKIFFGVLVIS